MSIMTIDFHFTTILSLAMMTSLAQARSPVCCLAITRTLLRSAIPTIIATRQMVRQHALQLEALCSAPEELNQKAQVQSFSVQYRIQYHMFVIFASPMVLHLRIVTLSIKCFLNSVLQLCVDALDRLGEGGKGSKAPLVKIPESAPIKIPGSPHTPSVLQPVAAIASLFNSREQRIQQQKERREKRKELMKLGKAVKTDTAAKGDSCGQVKKCDVVVIQLACDVIVTLKQVMPKMMRKTVMMMRLHRCPGAAARTRLWLGMCGWLSSERMFPWHA
jgi:hypothetical protein